MGEEMSNNSMLNNKTLAIIATNGFEQSELFEPRSKLEAMGAQIHLISIDDNQEIRAWDEKDWGESISVDKQIEQAKPSDYDAVILPGGQINPDVLRTNDKVISFIRASSQENRVKAIAAICHAPWLLAEADIVKDKKITSFPSIRTDMLNAGGLWEDEEVVVDGKLVTSRNPNDIPAFVEAIKSQLSE
jgi:protease I